MKVGLFSFHNFSRPGGVKTHILGLFEEFKKNKIEVKIVAPRRSIFEKYGKEIILLGTSLEIHFGGGESDFDIVFNPFSITKVLKEENFDVLHFHNLIFPAALQILTSPLSQKPLKILTFHSNLERSKFLEKFPIAISILNKVLNWKIDGLICVSNFLLKFFEDYKGPKIVIPNGIEIEKYEKSEPIKKFKDGKINILFVGRLEERKGFIFLLEAFEILKEKHKNIRLIVVGTGEKEKEYKEMVRQKRLSEIYFEGQKSDEEVRRFFKTCDIFVAPSIYGESFGIVLLEAMASKKPVVAFDIAGYNEVLTGRGREFLAKPKDSKDLAKKIEILIENPNLREEMGNWGFEYVQKYSIENVAKKVLDFYQFCQKEKS